MLSSMNRANAVQWIKDFGGKCCNVVKELFYDVSDLLYHQICNIKIVSWKKSLNYKKSNFNGPLTARVLQLENLLAKDAVACCKTQKYTFSKFGWEIHGENSDSKHCLNLLLVLVTLQIFPEVFSVFWRVLQARSSSFACFTSLLTFQAFKAKNGKKNYYSFLIKISFHLKQSEIYHFLSKWNISLFYFPPGTQTFSLWICSFSEFK